MTISVFDPFSTLDRVLSRMGAGSGYGTSQNLSLPMDVYRKGDEFIVEVDIPGVDPSTIDMTVECNMLTISGEVHPKHEDVDEIIVCERPHARFRRHALIEKTPRENDRSAKSNVSRGDVSRTGTPRAA